MSNGNFSMSLALALDFGSALDRHGWTEEEVKNFIDSDLICQVREVLAGRAVIKSARDFIDLDAAPTAPEGWTVRSHNGGGRFIWGADHVGLFISEKQTGYRWLSGTAFCAEASARAALNANVLDYLLLNPQLIPEEWKRYRVYFPGTVYSGSGGRPCVRGLEWVGSWICDGREIDLGFGPGYVAAIPLCGCRAIAARIAR